MDAPVPARVLLAALLLLARPAFSQDASPGGPPERSLTTLARQIALERAGFSPGLLDGLSGPKTAAALRAFQKHKGLAPESGAFDERTLTALAATDVSPTIRYTISDADAREVGPLPSDWNEKARLDRLRYPSLVELVAERGHTSRGTLEMLNPGVSLDTLKTGHTVVIPNAPPMRPWTGVARLEVDLDGRQIWLLEASGKPVGLLHCSIAKFAEKRPRGDASVTVIAFDPSYTFKPEMWPEVKNVKATLHIPPGPRNPVGLCWVGLSLPGYGIHGTPNPEQIGKTGSHGCIRLTNWDAVRLGKSLEVGTPVTFRGTGG